MTNAFSSNKKANQKYARVECFEAGIKLAGHEVKSVKAGRATINGAYVIIRGQEAFAVGLHIPAWQPNNITASYVADAPRKLLLNKKEIRVLADIEGKKGLAIILYSLYNKNGLIKALICVSKNKNTRDRRQEIKRRDQERDLKRSLKI